MKEKFIYENSLDDILAIYSQELSGGNENNEELGFCARVVEPNKADFTKYNHQTIVDRCNTLNQNVTKITNLYFYHKNHLGSVIAISDETGNIVETYKYDVYGNILDYTDSIIGNDIYYTAREFDKEVGLYYNRARYYSAKLGRFIGRDLIDIVDDINLYAYVGNNPVMYVDLMGTEAKSFVTPSKFEYSLPQKLAIGYTEGYIDFTTALVESAFVSVNAPGDLDVVENEKEISGATQTAIIMSGFIGPGKKADLVQEVAENITKKWDNFQCIECAKELGEAFKKEGIEFETLKLKGGNDFIYSEKFGKTISENGYHEAIKVGDKVYDNIYKKGINYNEFLDDLGVGIPGGPKIYK